MVPDSKYMPVPPTTDPNAKKNKKPLIIIISCVVLVAVVLAIVLPLTMCNNQSSAEKAVIAELKANHALDYDTATKVSYSANFNKEYSREEVRQFSERNKSLEQYEHEKLIKYEVKEVEALSEESVANFREAVSSRYKDADKVEEMKRVTLDVTTDFQGNGASTHTYVRVAAKVNGKWYVIPLEYSGF